MVLQGKDKPTYTPHIEKGDICVAVNANEVAFTGRKLTNKFYRWHIGYVGHLKERSLTEQMRRDPTKVIRKVVFRMLPKNRLQDDRARKLRIFVDDKHPFADKPLQPYIMPPQNVRELRPRARRASKCAQKKATNRRAKLALLEQNNSSTTLT